jgi:flavodoxin
MRKAIKIILAVFAVLILAIVAFGAVIFLDIAAYTATGSTTLASSGTSAGDALVVYDSGLSGAAKGVADKVAADLQAKNYTVTLAGIKSSAASNTVSYSIIVAGGPIYAGTPTSSVKDFLSNLHPTANVKVGVFGSGSGATTPEDVAQIKGAITAPSNAVIVKIGQNEDLNARAADFVAQLTN